MWTWSTWRQQPTSRSRAARTWTSTACPRYSVISEPTSRSQAYRMTRVMRYACEREVGSEITEYRGHAVDVHVLAARERDVGCWRHVDHVHIHGQPRGPRVRRVVVHANRSTVRIKEVVIDEVAQVIGAKRNGKAILPV